MNIHVAGIWFWPKDDYLEYLPIQSGEYLTITCLIGNL